MPDYDQIASQMTASAPSGGDPYDDIARQMAREQTAAIRANGQIASGVNPDQFARSRGVASRLGLPTASVVAAPTVPTRQAAGLAIDQHTQGAPTARQAYTQPGFTAVAHDDSHNVGLLDRLLQFAGTPLARSVALASPLSIGYGALDAVGQLFGYKPGDIPTSVAHGMVQGGAEVATGLGALGDIKNKAISAAVGNNWLASTALSAITPGGMLPTMQAIKPVSGYLSNEAKLLESKVQVHGRLAQAADMVGGLVPMLAAGEGAPLVMAMQGAGQQADAAIAKGKYGTTQSDVGILANAGLQGLLGRVAGGDLITRYVPQFGRALGEAAADAMANRYGAGLIANAAGQYVGEMGQAAANTLARSLGSAATGAVMQTGSNLIEHATVDHDRTILDGVGESATSMAALDILMHGVRSAMGASAERYIDVARGEHDRQLLDALNAISEASKVRQRASDVWQGYLQEATRESGAPDSVYVSQDAFTKAFSTPEGQVALANMPKTARDAIAVSARSGGDVRMPVDEFGTHVAGTPLYEQLQDHIKLDPNSYTRAQAGEVLRTEGPRVSDELDRVMRSKGDDAAFAASRDQVEHDILGQLNAAGRASGDNRINAKLGAHSIAALARRSGMTPEAFYAEHGFKIGRGAGDTVDVLRQDSEPHHNLSGLELGQEPITPENAVARAKEYFRTKLQGTVAHRAEIGDIRFTNAGWGKTRMGLKADPTRARLVPAVKAIIERGNYAGREALSEPRKDGIVAFHHFDGVVALEGEPHKVGVSVGEDDRGNLFYNLTRNPHDRYARRLQGVSAETREIARGTEPPANVDRNPETSAYDGGPGETGNTFYQIAHSGDDLNLTFERGPARGSFQPDTNTIHLGKDTNLSTFIHELGHYHLETLSRFADTHEAAGKDFDTVLHWFDPVMTRGKWNAMSIDERRPFHEQFAQGFERYL